MAQPKITDSEGNERVQRVFDIGGPTVEPSVRESQKDLIKVYHRGRSTLHLHDGRKLSPESEGYVTAADLAVPAIRARVLELKVEPEV